MMSNYQTWHVSGLRRCLICSKDNFAIQFSSPEAETFDMACTNNQECGAVYRLNRQTGGVALIDPRKGNDRMLSMLLILLGYFTSSGRALPDVHIETPITASGGGQHNLPSPMHGKNSGTGSGG